jgi:hypothetical protein
MTPREATLLQIVEFQKKKIKHLWYGVVLAMFIPSALALVAINLEEDRISELEYSLSIADKEYYSMLEKNNKLQDEVVQLRKAPDRCLPKLEIK